MAGGSMMSGATPSSTPQHNQEPPRGNHLCNQKTVERAYSLHRGKMERSASTTSFGVPPRQYEFLDSKISKNYKAQFEGRRTMKENQQLLAKLNTIHDEAVRRRLERQERARPSGPPLNRLKRAHRARAADQISRENVQILKRLQMLKPNYSAKSFARSRRREEKVIWLRHTDHTAGHLMKAPRSRAGDLLEARPLPPWGGVRDPSRPW